MNTAPAARALCERFFVLKFRGAPRGLRRTANEIGGIVDAARALVFGDLRIGAQRTRAVYLAVGTVRRGQLLRRFALFHPLLERADFVEHVGTFTAAAVTHSRL